MASRDSSTTERGRTERLTSALVTDQPAHSEPVGDLAVVVAPGPQLQCVDVAAAVAQRREPGLQGGWFGASAVFSTSWS